MAIIQTLGLPSKYEAGLGAHIGKKMAEGLLIDLPTAAIKTAAGIPMGGGQADSEEDKLLKEAINRILSRQRQAASGGLGGPVSVPLPPSLSLAAPVLGSSV